MRNEHDVGIRAFGSPRELTLPPDSLMVMVVRVGVTVGAVAVAVGAVGRNGDRHDLNMQGMKVERHKNDSGPPPKGLYTQKTLARPGQTGACKRECHL